MEQLREKTIKEYEDILDMVKKGMKNRENWAGLSGNWLFIYLVSIGMDRFYDNDWASMHLLFNKI